MELHTSTDNPMGPETNDEFFPFSEGFLHLFEGRGTPWRIRTINPHRLTGRRLFGTYLGDLRFTEETRICHPAHNQFSHIRLINRTTFGLGVWTIRTNVRVFWTDSTFVDLYAEFLDPIYDNFCSVLHLTLVIGILITEIEYSRVQVSNTL